VRSPAPRAFVVVGQGAVCRRHGLASSPAIDEGPVRCSDDFFDTHSFGTRHSDHQRTYSGALVKRRLGVEKSSPPTMRPHSLSTVASQRMAYFDA
jgi:hypothetical protein